MIFKGTMIIRHGEVLLFGFLAAAKVA